MSLSSTRFGGDVTGLHAGKLPPSPAVVSRRATLRGVAVAAMSLGASACTPAKGHAVPLSSDAALVDLGHHLQALAVRERDAWQRHSRAEDAAFKATPPIPTRREVASPYADLDALSPEERFAKLLADPVDFWATSNAADAEHRAALAEHEGVVAVIEKRHGVPRLERQASRLGDQVTVASERLAEMPATTPAGLAAKARVLLVLAGDDWMSRRAEFERHAALLESLLEDAARIGTEDARV